MAARRTTSKTTSTTDAKTDDTKATTDAKADDTATTINDVSTRSL